jgi:hypothetical protein
MTDLEVKNLVDQRVDALEKILENKETTFIDQCEAWDFVEELKSALTDYGSELTNETENTYDVFYKNQIKVAIDNESVNIYIDSGEDEDPVQLCYWHQDEWEEDPSILPSIFNAIDLAYSNPAIHFKMLKNNHGY